MNTYEVDVIRPGMEREYFAYRNHNRLAANGNMVVDPVTLWNTEAVQARTVEEAKLLATQKFPGRKFEIRRVR